MAVIKVRRVGQGIGKTKVAPGVNIGNGRMEVSDPRVISEMNSNFRKKSEIQRQNDTDALAIAARLYAGY